MRAEALCAIFLIWSVDASTEAATMKMTLFRWRHGTVSSFVALYSATVGAGVLLAVPFPELVPTPPTDPTGRPAMAEAENNAAAWGVFQTFTKPVLCAWDASDATEFRWSHSGHTLLS